MEYITPCESAIDSNFDPAALLTGLVKTARKTWEFFLYSSLFLALAAVGMAYTSCALQGILWTAQIAAVLALVVFSVYNLNRRTDEAEDALNHADRFRITCRYSKILFLSAILAYALALILAAMHGLSAALVAAIPIVSGTLYSVTVFPPGWKYRRLKEIPLGKNILVSGAWGASFSLLPVAMSNGSIGLCTLVNFLFIFSWTFVASVLPDIRDRTGDAATGVATIPVILGIRRTKIVLTLINLACGAVLVTLGLYAIRWAAALAALAVSLAYSQACILSIDRLKNTDLLCDVVSDGQFLAVGGFLFLITTGVGPVGHLLNLT
jgi:4-hydroxybenzoate polyprenyltransferase